MVRLLHAASQAAPNTVLLVIKESIFIIIVVNVQQEAQVCQNHSHEY